MFRGCLTSFLRCPIIGIKDQGQGDCAAPVKLHTPSFAFPFLPAACPFSPFTVHKEHPTLLSLGKWQHLFDLNRSGEDNEDLHWLFLFYACLMTTYFALAGPGFQPIIICPGFHSYAACHLLTHSWLPFTQSNEILGYYITFFHIRDGFYLEIHSQYGASTSRRHRVDRLHSGRAEALECYSLCWYYVF